MYIDYFNSVQTLINSNLNSIKTVDWYNNQYTRTEQLKATDYPAVYVEFENPMRWETGGDGLQYADTSITFHLVLFDVADAPSSALGIAKDLHSLLHSTTLKDSNNKPLSSSMVRTSSELIVNFDQLKIVKLVYSLAVYDYSTITPRTNIAPIAPNVLF